MEGPASSFVRGSKQAGLSEERRNEVNVSSVITLVVGGEDAANSAEGGIYETSASHSRTLREDEDIDGGRASNEEVEIPRV